MCIGSGRLAQARRKDGWMDNGCKGGTYASGLQTLSDPRVGSRSETPLRPPWPFKMAVIAEPGVGRGAKCSL